MTTSRRTGGDSHAHDRRVRRRGTFSHKRDLTKALTIRAHKFSARAQEKITTLGGKAEVIEA